MLHGHHQSLQAKAKNTAIAHEIQHHETTMCDSNILKRTVADFLSFFKMIKVFYVSLKSFYYEYTTNTSKQQPRPPNNQKEEEVHNDLELIELLKPYDSHTVD